MTLTRLLPTLRRSIPDPIAPARWPAGTRVTTTDVIVGGMSMVRLAERGGTPLAHLDPAPAGAAGDRALHLGVVLATVRSISSTSGRTEAVIDARFGPHRPDWAEARLIGRASVAHVAQVSVRAAAGGCLVVAPLELPGDLAVGDLIAVPITAHGITITAPTDQRSAVQPSTAQPSAAQPSAAQRRAVQPSTAQPSAAQRSAGATSAANSSSPERSYAASGA